MKRAWVAGFSSLILHAGALGALLPMLSGSADRLTPVLVELRPPVVERLAPVRVSSQKPRAPSLPPPAEPGPPPLSAAQDVEPPTAFPPASPAPSTEPVPGPPRPDARLQSEPGGRSADIVSTRQTGPGVAPEERPAAASRPSPNGEAAGGAGEIRVPGPPGPESPLSAILAPSPPGPASDESGFLTLLRSQVQAALVYPPPAVRRGLAGMVELEVRLRPDGSVETIRVAKSSGHALLDQAAMRTVEGAAPFLLPDRRAVVVLVPIAFELR